MGLWESVRTYPVNDQPFCETEVRKHECIREIYGTIHFKFSPTRFCPLKVTYSQSSTPWWSNELIIRFDHEERRLKAEGHGL